MAEVLAVRNERQPGVASSVVVVVVASLIAVALAARAALEDSPVLRHVAWLWKGPLDCCLGLVGGKISAFFASTAVLGIE